MFKIDLDELYNLLSTAELTNKQKNAVVRGLVRLQRFPDKSTYTMIKSTLLANQKKEKGRVFSRFNLFKKRPTNSDMDINAASSNSFYQKCYLNLQNCAFGNILPDNKKAFVMMPFNDEKLDLFYKKVIKPSLARKGIKCTRADERFDVPNALCKICKSIRESGILIADMFGKNPNVFCEIGMCFGLGRRVLLVCQSNNDNPFDTSVIDHLKYNPDDSSSFIPKFDTFVEEALKSDLKILKDYSKSSGTQESSSVDSKVFDEIYKPLYQRVSASIQLLDRNLFENGVRNNTIGDKVLNLIDNLKLNIYWEKVDNELRDTLAELYKQYEDTLSLGSTIGSEILDSLNEEFESIDLSSENQENRPIFEIIRDLFPFVLKEYSELDDYRKERIDRLILINKMKTSDNRQFTGEEFWIFFQNLIYKIDNFITYLENRKRIKGLLNEIKNRISDF